MFIFLTLANETTLTPEGFELFVDRLVEEKNLTNVDPEVLKELKSDLVKRVEDRVNAMIIERLPAEKLPEFEKLLDGGDNAAIQSFSETNIPNLPEVIAAELLAFRQTYLG